MKMLERMAAYKAANEERQKWEVEFAKKDEELDAERKKSEAATQQLDAERKKSEATARENEALRLKLQQAGLQ
jgi:Skp family chaperone for outer membrane proteins